MKPDIEGIDTPFQCSLCGERGCDPGVQLTWSRKLATCEKICISCVRRVAEIAGFITLHTEDDARLRRCEDIVKSFICSDGHKQEQWCERRDRWSRLNVPLIHAHDCDAAIELNLPREEGTGE